MTRLLLVDDHPLFRQALRGAISGLYPDIEIDDADTLKGARKKIAESVAVGLILLDLTMPDCNGVSGLVDLRTRYPELPVVVVSASEDTDTIRRSMAHGASGFIPKSASVQQISEALDAVFSGETWFPLRSTFASERDRSQILTPAQSRMLIALQRGLANKQIAYELGVSEAMVKAHMSALFRRLGVQNRTQALVAAQPLLDHELFTQRPAAADSEMLAATPAAQAFG